MGSGKARRDVSVLGNAHPQRGRSVGAGEEKWGAGAGKRKKNMVKSLTKKRKMKTT